MKELLDIFDSKMNIIGTKDREEVHKHGFWHQTFHCWIIKNLNNKKYVIVQKRDKNKKVAPNYLDITAAGHLTTGETPLDGIREIEEELGIHVDSQKIIRLGVRISVSESKNNINKEFCHVCLLENNLPLSKYILQKDEVSALVEIEIKDGLDLFTGKVDVINCNSMYIDNGKKKETLIEVKVKDFIPRIEPYYLKIFIMAERFYEGKTGLAI